MAEPIHELAGLRVTVDQIVYRPDAQAPEGRPNCFAYFISIHNDSDITVTIRGRKWIVRDAAGSVMALEGDGVVGEFPVIEPGEKFSYQSFHAFDTENAVAEGSYLGVAEDGRRVFTRIPSFEMRVPYN